MSSIDAYTPSRAKKYTRPRGWILIDKLPHSRKALAVRADILDRLQQHAQEDTLPRGGRGLFYDLRPHGIASNPRGVIYTKHPVDKSRASMEVTPDYVNDLLCSMRRVFDPESEKWLIDEDWISDSRAPAPLEPNETENARAGADLIARHIRRLHLARQAGQRVYLELRCEAQDLMPRIARVALPYGVHVYSGSGADGLKPKREAAERASRRAVNTVIALITDYDKAGGDIGDAFAEDALAFVDWHREYENALGSVSVDRLALTRKQALEHDLLDIDGKAEVDGLPVQVLDALVRDFIESHLDMRIQRKVIAAEPKMHADVVRHLQRVVAKKTRR
jgi:hypothetical protein